MPTHSLRSQGQTKLQFLHRSTRGADWFTGIAYRMWMTPKQLPWNDSAQHGPWLPHICVNRAHLQLTFPSQLIHVLYTSHDPETTCKEDRTIYKWLRGETGLLGEGPGTPSPPPPVRDAERHDNRLLQAGWSEAGDSCSLRGPSSTTEGEEIKSL